MRLNTPDPPATEPVDDDVEAEFKSVEQKTDGYAVRAYDLRKVYRQGFNKVLACKHVTFGLEYGDCFALLGINGAGKTTTFKMLTGEVVPTSGVMTIGEFNVRRQF